MGDGVDIVGEKHISPESDALYSLNCRKVTSKKRERRLPARAHFHRLVLQMRIYMHFPASDPRLWDLNLRFE